MDEKIEKKEETKDEPENGAIKKRELRVISREELKKILEAHRKWVDTEGKEGTKADLGYANLQEAYLGEANLQEADLKWANLLGANLFYANLQEANLGGANLQEALLGYANLQEAFLAQANLQKANFTKANLQNADLSRAVLQEANLQDADLTGGKGLLAGQFAGLDVSGAKLPGDIHEFEGPLKVVEEASKNARKLFFGMLAGCAYTFLTIATTTDARLLTNSASSPLPIIGTAIPIVGFYLAAPLLLLGLYIYFHLYLQRMWEGLAKLPAIFPDGRSLDEKAYPWLLIGYIRAHIKLLAEGRPLMSRLQVVLSILLAWWSLPAILIMLWGRYLARHDWIVTSLHILVLVVAIGAGIYFQCAARFTLRRQEMSPFLWKSGQLQKGTGVVLAIGLLFFLCSWFAISAVVRIPKITIADFTEVDVSTKPETWTGKEVDLVKGARLKGADLQYAKAKNAFLVKADLRGANLQEANLWGANLQGANLSEANLQKAALWEANLQGANLFNAKLQGASRLFVEQLSKVETLYMAQLDPRLMKKIEEKYPHLLEEPKEEHDEEGTDSPKNREEDDSR